MSPLQWATTGHISFWVWALIVFSAAGPFLVVPDVWPQIKQFIRDRRGK